MPMKIAQLPLHLSPDDAHTLLDFLSQLQDLLWNHYGDAIRIAHNRHSHTPTQHQLDFDDPLPPF